MRIIDRLLAPLRVQRKPPSETKPIPISKHLPENRQRLLQILVNCPDLVCRQLQVGSKHTEMVLFFLKGLTDELSIQDYIMRPLLRYSGPTITAELLQKRVLEVRETSQTSDLAQAISRLLRGEAVLFMAGEPCALLLNTSQHIGRLPEEPQSETTITGPRDGFVENLERNLALIRRRLPTPELRSQQLQLGLDTLTRVTVCYLADKVETGLLAEVMQRLRHLEQLGVPRLLDTSCIAEAIEDHPNSPFPQTMETERPDRTVSNLLEGRICILMEGTPKALIIPAALSDMFQSPEDYYQPVLPATVARWLRYLGAFLATTSSAIYVAVITFHYELIPQRLVFSVARNRSMLPFTPMIEALLLEAAVELLREATNRLPTSVGQVIGVVGALVLGQSAVQANVVSPLIVIVVAISTIASFTIPNNPGAAALRLTRFPLILASGFL